MVWSWTLVLVAGINSTIGNLMLKKSSIVYNQAHWFDSVLNVWFIGGLFFYATNVLLFAYALKTLPVSAAYPVLAGSGFVILALVSPIVFSEKLSMVQGLGIVVVFAGILMISFGNGS